MTTFKPNYNPWGTIKYLKTKLRRCQSEKGKLISDIKSRDEKIKSQKVFMNEQYGIVSDLSLRKDYYMAENKKLKGEKYEVELENKKLKEQIKGLTENVTELTKAANELTKTVDEMSFMQLPFDRIGTCPLCCDNNVDCAFGCGHCYCKWCFEKIDRCSICRKPLGVRVVLRL